VNHPHHQARNGETIYNAMEMADVGIEKDHEVSLFMRGKGGSMPAQRACRMSKYQEITEARKLLRLPETAIMEEIKSNYRALLSEWHPDKCGENQERRNEMTRKMISAYNIK
jgi:DnaJ-domain-containing protein 1